VKILSDANVKKKEKRLIGVHILHFYWSFSSDIWQQKGSNETMGCVQKDHTHN